MKRKLNREDFNLNFGPQHPSAHGVLSSILEIKQKKNRFTGNEVCLCFDIPMDWQVSFQDPAIPLMEGLLDLHHDIMFIIVTIITLVFYLLVRFILPMSYIEPNKIYKKKQSTIKKSRRKSYSFLLAIVNIS